MPNILILDDDEEMCEELSDILRDEGFAVAVQHDGKKGSDMLSRTRFDILLLDVKLPGLDGYQILSTVKSRVPGIKVIVLSGGALTRDPDDKTAAFDEKEKILRRADALMNKPYDIAALVAKIRAFAP